MSARWAALLLLAGGLVVGCGDDPDETSDPPVVDTGPDGGEGDGESAPCTGDDPVALMACVDAERYLEDLVFVAQERASGSAHWQAVQTFCAARLMALGFEVELHAYGSGVNVIGTLRGTASEGPTVIVSAHYDHIPGCAGADDNASGVAAALEIARALSGADFGGTLKIAFWDEEELGLVGSRAYAQRAAAQGEQIEVMYALDMIAFASDAPDSQRLPENIDVLFPAEVDALVAGGSRANFIPVGANASADAHARRVAEYAEAVDLLAYALVIPAGLETNPLLADLARSDHAPFWEAGYPAIIISDTAELRNPYYHCAGGPDAVDTLDQAFAVKVVRATLGAVTAALRSE